jgi:shikimate dehydrogenase
VARDAARRPIRLGVLGDPLAFTRSPALHRAGLQALGLRGESQAIRTAPGALGARLAELAAAGYRGVNLTAPLKEAALAHLDAVSAAAREARSVNTVCFDPGATRGETTDGPGALDLLRELGRDPSRERVVILGAGGAARALGLALARAGASVMLSARRPADREPDALPRVAWRSAAEAGALAEATLVINATPLGGAPGGAGSGAAAPPDEPAPLERLARPAAVLDLVYGERVTAWVERARALGHPAWDGLGLLVHQARRSLMIWLEREVPLDPLARAVGWPR